MSRFPAPNGRFAKRSWFGHRCERGLIDYANLGRILKSGR